MEFFTCILANDTFCPYWMFRTGCLRTYLCRLLLLVLLENTFPHVYFRVFVVS